jgi:MFS family permease
MVLMAVLNVSITIFEIPTGIVADKVGRKTSVFIGSCLEACAIPVMIVASDYRILIFGFFLWGIGETFISGANIALLYDSLKLDGKEQEGQKTIGTANSILLFARVGGTAACGVLLIYLPLSVPFWVFFSLLLGGAMVALTFREPRLAIRSEEAKEVQTLKTRVIDYVSHLKDSFRVIGQSGQVFILVCLSVLLVRFNNLIHRPYAQPYLISFGYPVSYLGYFYAGFFIVEALSSKLSHQVTKKLGSGEHRIFVFVLCLAVLSLAFFAFPWTGVVVVASIVGVSLLSGLSRPAVLTSLNRRLSSEKRATCNSIASMGNSFLGLFLGPIYGYLSDAYSLKTSVRIFLWSFGPLLILCLVMVWRILKSIPAEETPEKK